MVFLMDEVIVYSILYGWVVLKSWNPIRTILFRFTDEGRAALEDEWTSLTNALTVQSILEHWQSLWLIPESDCGSTFDGVSTNIFGGSVYLGGCITATGTLNIDAAENITFEGEINAENLNLNSEKFHNNASMHGYDQIGIAANETINNGIISAGKGKPEKIYEMLETATTLAPTNNLTNASPMAAIPTSSTTLDFLVIFIFCKIF